MDMELDLAKKIKEVNILNVDKNSIVIIHFDISNMHPSEIDKYILKARKTIFPMFEKRGADLMILPFRRNQQTTIDIIKNGSMDKLISQFQVKTKLTLRKEEAAKSIKPLTKGKVKGSGSIAKQHKKNLKKPIASGLRTIKDDPFFF